MASACCSLPGSEASQLCISDSSVALTLFSKMGAA
jgi:hypothetical protein